MMGQGSSIRVVVRYKGYETHYAYIILELVQGMCGAKETRALGLHWGVWMAASGSYLYDNHSLVKCMERGGSLFFHVFDLGPTVQAMLLSHSF